MQFVLFRNIFLDFRVKNDETPLTIATKIWYNFCVMVTKTGFGRKVIVKIVQTTLKIMHKY